MPLKKSTNATLKKPSAEITSKIRTLVLTLGDDELAAETVAKKFDFSPDNATTLVKRARKAIKAAAEVDQRAALGEALSRLENIFSIAILEEDAKTALAAQKELNKLQSIYNKIEQRETAKVDREKEETRKILESVGEPAGLRLDDLARKIVYRLIAAETR